MKRFEVWIVQLDPVRGSETGKTRPGVIVSPDDINDALRTVVVAPLTSVRRPWPTRAPVEVGQTLGDVALDQVRTVDKRRLLGRIATLSEAEAKVVAARFVEMFTL